MNGIEGEPTDWLEDRLCEISAGRKNAIAKLARLRTEGDEIEAELRRRKAAGAIDTIVTTERVDT